MVAALKASRVLRTPAAEQAMLSVPRHHFLPEVDLKAAYADTAVVVKRGPQRSPISSASQPTMVATMLEFLEADRGDHILEIGTGTGYNAALVACMVGGTGDVVSVELEPDLAERATAALHAIGANRVRVFVGDGRSGHDPGAPYDRVIVTTGAHEIATSWIDQLRDGGRLVVPLVDDAGIGSVVGFHVEGQTLRRIAEAPCGFLLIRSEPCD